MRTYGQFCPIARGSEILAERWTPIILRNLLLGCRTFNEIAAGAPGLSRALLARRLRELERAGVLEIRAKPNGRGSVYEPTPAGKDLAGVLESIGGWAERWTEMTGDHADPDVVLWSWIQTFLRRDLLPDGLCRFDPGFGDDLVVAIDDPLAFARWHMGRTRWEAALRAGGITVTGPRALRQALPTWNGGPKENARMRVEHGLPVGDLA